MDRRERARQVLGLRTQDQVTEHLCDHCFGSPEGRHPNTNAPSGYGTCQPCCACGGDGYYFQVRENLPVFYVWDLLGEARPKSCGASGVK